MYNQIMYNEQTYNGPHTLHVLALADSNLLNETFGPQTVLSVLFDAMSLSDSMVMMPDVLLQDFVFLSELIQFQFTEKILTDQVRLNDWLSIQKLFIERWHD